MRSASLAFDSEERTRIEAAIAAAERTTAGELVVCVANRSGRYDRGEDLFGVLLGLLAVAVAWLGIQGVTEGDWGPAPVLGLLPVLLLFLGGFLAGAVLATRLPALGLFFTSRSEMRAEVHRQAGHAFQRLGVGGTRQATGILIFISLLERMVWVVGDDAIEAQIPQARWDEMRDAIVAGFRDGRAADGLVGAIEQAGALLQEHLPGSHEEGGHDEGGHDDVDQLDNTIRFVDM